MIYVNTALIIFEWKGWTKCDAAGYSHLNDAFQSCVTHALLVSRSMRSHEQEKHCRLVKAKWVHDTHELGTRRSAGLDKDMRWRELEKDATIKESRKKTAKLRWLRGLHADFTFNF